MCSKQLYLEEQVLKVRSFAKKRNLTKRERQSLMSSEFSVHVARIEVISIERLLSEIGDETLLQHTLTHSYNSPYNILTKRR